MHRPLRSFMICALVVLVVTALPPVAGRGLGAAEEDALTKRVVSELEVFTSWLRANDARGFVGEVGWPTGGSWNELAERWYADADASELWVAAWATGEWWGTEYELATYEDSDRTGGVDSASPQASIVQNHWSSDEVLRGVNVAGGEFAHLLRTQLPTSPTRTLALTASRTTSTRAPPFSSSRRVVWSWYAFRFGGNVCSRASGGGSTPPRSVASSVSLRAPTAPVWK
jgi:hypothetical protein